MVELIFQADNSEELKNEVIKYAEVNGLIPKAGIERTPRVMAALNVFEKIVAHLPTNKFHAITAEDFKVFVNHCHDANGRMIFPTVDQGKIRKMQFVPSAESVSTDIV